MASSCARRAWTLPGLRQSRQLTAPTAQPSRPVSRLPQKQRRRHQGGGGTACLAASRHPRQPLVWSFRQLHPCSCGAPARVAAAAAWGQNRMRPRARPAPPAGAEAGQARHSSCACQRRRHRHPWGGAAAAAARRQRRVAGRPPRHAWCVPPPASSCRCAGRQRRQQGSSHPCRRGTPPAPRRGGDHPQCGTSRWLWMSLPRRSRRSWEAPAAGGQAVARAVDLYACMHLFQTVNPLCLLSSLSFMRAPRAAICAPGTLGSTLSVTKQLSDSTTVRRSGQGQGKGS